MAYVLDSQPVPTTEKTDVGAISNDVTMQMNGEEEHKTFLDCNPDLAHDQAGSRKCVNVDMIPLRIAVFCWYGAACIPIIFLSVFVKQRGVTLVEFSSIFSVTFLFQFLCASISGVVADKIGNAKPVLMFHIGFTVTVLICMLLTPSVNVSSCNEEMAGLTCSDSFGSEGYSKNISVMVEQFEFCNMTCTESNKTFSMNDVAHPVGEMIEDSGDMALRVPINASMSSANGNLITLIYTNVSSKNISEFVCRELRKNCSVECLRNYHSGCKLHDKKILIIYAILIILFFTSWSTVHRFMDVTVMTLVHKNKSDFGHERFFFVFLENLL